MTKADYSHRLRVRYAETDRGGVAHHSSYVLWLEEARTEWMRWRGKAYSQVEAEGNFLVVVEMSLRYLSSVTYDDEVEIRVFESKRQRTSLFIDYELLRVADGQLIATAQTRLASTDGHGKVRRLPPGV